jgi:hypothetical protein
MQTVADLKYLDFRHNPPSFSSSPKNFEGIALNKNDFEETFHLCKSKTERNLDRTIPR